VQRFVHELPSLPLLKRNDFGGFERNRAQRRRVENVCRVRLYLGVTARKAQPLQELRSSAPELLSVFLRKHFQESRKAVATQHAD
jgi:hypothetical protein